jgi:Protein of unknown function (DUF1186)/SEC-C motif
MEVVEIIKRLEWVNKGFDYEAVAAAVAQREEITPALLGILEKVAEQGRAFDTTGNYMARLFAMYLLAQFRETRAYPLVVRIALFPSDDLDSLLGDFVTVSLRAVLASVCGGELDGIKSIIENESADEWARGGAIGSLVTLVAAGITSREEVVEYFASLYRDKLPRTPENEEVWSELVCSTADLYPEELMGDIERAYEDDLVDPTFVDVEDVRNDLAKGKQQVLDELFRSPNHQLVNDTAKEFGSWASFEAQEEDENEEDDFVDLWDEEEPLEDEDKSLDFDRWLNAPSSMGSSPYRRATPKVGRNDPCPCGSGKKYKKCCVSASTNVPDVFS